MAMTIKLAALGAALAAMGAIGTNNVQGSESDSSDISISKNIKVLKASNDDQSWIVDASKMLLDKISSAGVDMIKGGIATYAKTFVINILNDYGFDFRDPTIRYLEKIEKEIQEIKYKVDSIDQKIEKYHAEDVLNNLQKKLSKTEIEYSGIVKNGLWTIAIDEASGSKGEKELEAERYQFYLDFLKDLKVDGFQCLANYVTDLAKTMTLPNTYEPENDIFYYYNLTLGQYDKWSVQSYKNRRSYIAYLDSILLTAANAAQFDTYYRVKDLGNPAKNTYKGYMDTMALEVNKANAMFQKELKRLDEYETLRKDKQTVIYLPNGKQYSSRLATLTYNHNDKVGDESRQALLKAVKGYGSRYYRESGFAYEPNKDIVNAIRNDFNAYAKNFGGKDYTLKDYLKNAGFYAKDENLFNNAAGMFYGDLSAEGCGYLNHDTKIYSTYINQKGESVRRQIYEVCIYHTWIGGLDHAELRYNCDDYFYCLMDPEQKYLDGQYDDNYFDRMTRTLSDALFYKDEYTSWCYTKAIVRDCY